MQKRKCWKCWCGKQLQQQRRREVATICTELQSFASGTSGEKRRLWQIETKTRKTGSELRTKLSLKLKVKIVKFQTTQKELVDMSSALDSERYRAERLEGQINDLTELHQVKLKIFSSRSKASINCLSFWLQNEIENLKQAMADMEEKVQYQSDERLRDVHEVLENCQTRVSLPKFQ